MFPITNSLFVDFQQVEIQVRRRIAIGSFLSERKLIDELTRQGLSESTVIILQLTFLKQNNKQFFFFQIRRAVLIMVARDELEYRRERRVVFRKA